MNDNIITGCLIDTYEDYILFSNISDNDRLYMSDRIGNAIKLSDRKVKRFVTNGIWIYCLSSDSSTIFRVSFDGRFVEDLYYMDNIDDFTLFREFILVVKNERIIEMNIETGAIKTFQLYKKLDNPSGIATRHINNIFLTENCLFFVDENTKLYKIPSSLLQQSFSDGYKKLLEANNVSLDELIRDAKRSGYDFKDINDIEKFMSSFGEVDIAIIFDDTDAVNGTNNVAGYSVNSNMLYCIEPTNYVNEFLGGCAMPIYSIKKINLEQDSFVKVVSQNVAPLYFNDDLGTYKDTDNNCKLTIKASNLFKLSDICSLLDSCGILDEVYLHDVKNSLFKVSIMTSNQIPLEIT